MIRSAKRDLDGLRRLTKAVTVLPILIAVVTSRSSRSFREDTLVLGEGASHDEAVDASTHLVGWRAHLKILAGKLKTSNVSLN